MLLGARQFFERRGTPTPPPPYDYEVEWIASDGNAWIDTGFVPNGLVEWQMRCVLGTQYVQAPYFGCRTAATAFKTAKEILFGYNCFYSDRRFSLKPKVDAAYYGWNNTANDGNAYFDGAFHDVACEASSATGSYGGYALKIDGTVLPLKVQAEGANSETNTTTCAIFAFKVGDSAAYITPASLGFKLQSLQMGGIDLIAVRKGTTAYLYDRATDRLLGNSGTGAFLYGPDKS